MTQYGKNINLFLIDGSVTGCMKCTLANWTGVAYKIPRTMLDACKTRRDLMQSGVYFLFGKSDKTGDDVVYVGQAGTRKSGKGILYRLYDHKRNPEKNYWTEAVAFTTSNNSFGPTEICYLENRFETLARQAARYKVTNKCEPSRGNVTEEKNSELEEFIEYAKIIMGTLGHKVFIAKDEAQTAAANEPAKPAAEPILHLVTAKTKASGKRTSDGFVVFKGSLLAQSPTRSCPAAIKALREKYAEKIKSDNVLREDVIFSSPSAAAGFVVYASANGQAMWSTEDGKTLKYLESSDLV